MRAMTASWLATAGYPSWTNHEVVLSSRPGRGRVPRDREDLREHDLHVVRTDPGRDGGDAMPAIEPRDRGELPVPPFDLDGVEALSDRGSPVRGSREEEVLGHFAGAESDVVLARADRECNAGIRARQASQ